MTIGSANGGPSRVSQFLQSVRFFSVQDQFEGALDAIARHIVSPVHYLVVDLERAKDTLSGLLKLEPGSRPRLIVLGPEETYFLDQGNVNLAAFADTSHWPSLEKLQSDPDLEYHKATGEWQSPEHLETQLQLAKASGDNVWMLLQQGDWDLGGKSGGLDSLFVRTEGSIKRIRREELLLVEAQRDYLVLATAKERLRVLRSMKSIESRLDPDVHCRVHRSFIVNLRHLHTIDAEELWIDGLETPVPIGPNYKKLLLKKLDIL